LEAGSERVNGNALRKSLISLPSNTTVRLKGATRNLPTKITAILGAITKTTKPNVTNTMLIRAIKSSFRGGELLKHLAKNASMSGKITAEAMSCPDALKESKKLA
jgi:hypothetical protein